MLKEGSVTRLKRDLRLLVSDDFYGESVDVVLFVESETLLFIKEMRKEDEISYKCFCPNHDKIYFLRFTDFSVVSHVFDVIW